MLHMPEVLNRLETALQVSYLAPIVIPGQGRLQLLNGCDHTFNQPKHAVSHVRSHAPPVAPRQEADTLEMDEDEQPASRPPGSTPEREATSAMCYDSPARVPGTKLPRAALMDEDDSSSGVLKSPRRALAASPRGSVGTVPAGAAAAATTVTPCSRLPRGPSAMAASAGGVHASLPQAPHQGRRCVRLQTGLRP